MNIDGLIVTRTVNGEISELQAFDAIEIDVRSLTTGQYFPADDYSPAEYPSVDVISVKLVKPLALYDEDLRIVTTLAAGTEIYADLSDSQFQEIINEELEAISA